MQLGDIMSISNLFSQFGNVVISISLFFTSLVLVFFFFSH